MSSSLNHAVYSQIKSLVQGLVNRKSVRNVKNDLNSLVSSEGVEAEKYMLICLFESIDFKDSKVQSGNKDQSKTQFLAQRLMSSSNSETFIDYFSQVKNPSAT